MNSPHLKEVICLEVFKGIVKALHEGDFGDHRLRTGVDAFKPDKKLDLYYNQFCKIRAINHLITLICILLYNQILF